MIEVTTAASIFDKILSVFNLVKSGKIERNEKVDLALDKTHKALIATKAYIRSFEIGERDYSAEGKLAGLWYEASIPMRHVDKELSKILQLKGGYWSSPEKWDDMKSGDADISLNNVESLIIELL